jgi:hypothetical protein
LHRNSGAEVSIDEGRCQALCSPGRRTVAELTTSP